jgi:hypothetical protein
MNLTDKQAKTLREAVRDPGQRAGRRLGPSWGEGNDGFAAEQEDLWAWIERAVTVACLKPLLWQLSEAKTVLEGWEQTGETIGHFIPEHYEGSEGAFLAIVEEWATHAFEVVRHAHAWRKTRSDDDAAKVDAAVEKIYPSEDYV